MLHYKITIWEKLPELNNLDAHSLCDHYNYVTGFVKTVPIGTTIEIHFMA